jgi:hypothetical protein
MSDADYSQAFAALANTDVSAQEAADTLASVFGNPEVQKAFALMDGIHRVVYREMLDGTPIVDAEPFEFRRDGVWYRADGTPVDEGNVDDN